MKRPVLRIKKGSDTYDDRQAAPRERRGREEPGRASARKPLSFLRLRRGSLVPLLIVVLIAAILLRVLPRSGARANLAGWHVFLEARALENVLQVGVGFSREDSRGAPEPSASVLFTLPDTGEQAEASGVLHGRRAALLAEMKYTGREKTLRAIVWVDGQSQTLTLSLPGP